MIREITTLDEKQKMKNEFLKLFKIVNPFKEVFNDAIVERIIIYPTDGFYLTQSQFEAIIKSAKMIGDDSIYISEVESESDCFEMDELEGIYQCRHWITENSASTNNYLEIPLVIENAVYSPQGKWGLIISHEDHAVLGGTDEFMKNFKMNYESWSNDIHTFEKAWKKNEQEYNSNIDWLPKLIRHISQSR